MPPRLRLLTCGSVDDGKSTLIGRLLHDAGLIFSDQLDTIHGRIHGWVGGHMRSIPFSAYDPIFWAHHTMVDRVWRLWQLEHNQYGPPRSLWDRALPPFDMTVRETLTVASLGYDYAGVTVSQATAA